MKFLDTQEIEHVSGAAVNYCDLVGAAAFASTGILLAAAADAARVGLVPMTYWTLAGAAASAVVAGGAVYAGSHGWGVCAPVSGGGGTNSVSGFELEGYLTVSD